jgi:hypothetical protein
MSAAPDPADLAPSRDLAAYGRRAPLMPSLLVWIGVCIACLVAGAAIGRFGFAPPARPEPEAAEPATHPAAASVPASAEPAPASLAAPGQPGDTALGERVTRLEGAETRVDAAAAEALAAAALSTAAQGSAPFDQDVAAYERLAPGDPDLRALAPLAVQGAPSRAALAAALPDLAGQAAEAAHAPPARASFARRLWAAISKVVILRRVDPAAPGVDGALTRAEDAAAAGDLAAAVRELDSLPRTARAPLADWLAAAQRRIEIDARIEALRARALAALAAPTAGRS